MFPRRVGGAQGDGRRCAERTARHRRRLPARPALLRACPRDPPTGTQCGTGPGFERASPDGRKRERGTMTEMRTITGHVRNGYIVSDEPAEHPEGTPVLLRIVRAILPNGEVLEGA